MTTPSPEHTLSLDLTAVNLPHRLRLIRDARKAGAVVLNDNIETLMDSAPPEPRKAGVHGLEVELATRAPFSFRIYRNRAPRGGPKGMFDPDFKSKVAELVKHRGVKDRAVSRALDSLSDRNGSPMSSNWGNRGNLETMEVTTHRGPDYEAITLHNPGAVTAERLIEFGHGLAEGMAHATLAILVEVSRDGLHDSQLIQSVD